MIILIRNFMKMKLIFIIFEYSNYSFSTTRIVNKVFEGLFLLSFFSAVNKYCDGKKSRGRNAGLIG